MDKYINKNSSEFPIHQFSKKLNLNDLLWSYDTNSLNPSAMSDDMSIFPRIETGYAFRPDMNDEVVKKFNEVIFTQGRPFLKIKYNNPKKFNRSTPPSKRTSK